MATNIAQVLDPPTTWAASYTDEDQASVALVIEWLNDPAQRGRGWHRAALARAAGINKGRVHQILAGTYPSSPTAALAAMTNVVQREHDRARHNIGMVFAPTSVYRLVVAACHRAHLYRNFAVVSAFVGTGKTVSIKRYADEHANTYLLEATPGMTAEVLLTDLVEMTDAVVARTNRHSQGTRAERLRAVIRALKGTDSLLILDEAENTTTQTLEYVRRIRDLAEVGVVLSGSEKLQPMLRDPRGRFGQISSRVGFWPPVVRGITEEDAHTITRTVLGERDDLTDEVLDAFWQMCDGSARVLGEDLIPGVRDYGLRKGLELSADLVFQVGQDVLGFKRPTRSKTAAAVRG